MRDCDRLWAGASDGPLNEEAEVVVGLVGLLDEVAEVELVREDEAEVLVESVDPGHAQSPGLLEVDLGLEGDVVGEVVLTGEGELSGEVAAVLGLLEVLVDELDGVVGSVGVRVVAAEGHVLLEQVSLHEEVALGVLEGE